MSDELKTEDLFDKLADQLINLAEAVIVMSKGAYAIPPTSGIKKLWDKLDKELADMDSLRRNEFVVRNGNTFFFVSMYLKAARLQDVDKRESILSGLTYAQNLGANAGFLRNEYKQLTKRMEQ
jgi:hypothetical protein